MRRGAAVGLAFLMLSAACNGTDSSSPPTRRRPDPTVGPARAGTTPTPEATFTTPAVPTPTPGRVLPASRTTWARGLPPLIVSNGSAVRRHRRGTSTLLGTVDGAARVAFATGAGAALVERVYERGSRSDLLELRRNRDPERLDTGPAYVSLLDVALVDGIRRVLFTTYHEPAAEQGETTGYLYLEDVDGGGRRRLTEASGPEYEITRASYGGGVIVASGWTDLTESFEFFRPDGTEVEDRPDPTEDLPYGNPPYMSDAVLSPDGERLAYLEGPDWDQAAQERTGDWVLVVGDQRSGDELLRVKVADRDVCVPWLDYDGRWLVVSRSEWSRNDSGYEVCGIPEADALSVVVVDSGASSPELIEVTSVVGVATIDD